MKLYKPGRTRLAATAPGDSILTLLGEQLLLVFVGLERRAVVKHDAQTNEIK